MLQTERSSTNGFWCRLHTVLREVSAARMGPTVCAAAPAQRVVGVQVVCSICARQGALATRATAIATPTLPSLRVLVSSAEQHGARKAVCAARTVPTDCAAVLGRVG